MTHDIEALSSAIEYERTWIPVSLTEQDVLDELARAAVTLHALLTCPAFKGVLSGEYVVVPAEPLDTTVRQGHSKYSSFGNPLNGMCNAYRVMTAAGNEAEAIRKAVRGE